MELDDAIRSAIDGDSLLFVGAGISFLSRGMNGKAIPNSQTLTDLLLDQPPGTGSKHTLERISGSILRKRGRDHIYRTISDNFMVESVDDILKFIYSLPWKRIYTTNYDNAIETAQTGQRRPISLTVDDNQSEIQIGSIIHLNGYVKKITPQNVETSLLLTDTSYAASRLRDTGWLSAFEKDISSSRSVFFIGYSLFDLDIDRVLYRSEQTKRKFFFSISPDADEIESSTIERYGSIVPGGIDQIYQNFLKQRSVYTPPSFPRSFTALRELTKVDNETNNSDTSAQILYKQLVHGILPEKEVLNGLNLYDNQPYIIPRQQDKIAQDEIRHGPWKDILFTGEIASGKSASTLILASFLINEGYRVFYAQKGPTLSSELSRLGEINEKISVIFDGYSSYRDEIRNYADRRSPLHRIILTERSAVHEFIGDFIYSTPHLGPVREITLDKIDGQDVPSFEALTNFGGFWGERAGSSPESRRKFIQSTLLGSLYRLLVEIIKSQKVQS